MSRADLSFRRWMRLMAESSDQEGLLAGAWAGDDPNFVMSAFADWQDDSGNPQMAELIRRAVGSVGLGVRGSLDAQIKHQCQNLQRDMDLGGWETTMSYNLSDDGYWRSYSLPVEGGHLGIVAKIDTRQISMHGRFYDPRSGSARVTDATGATVAEINVPSQERWMTERSSRGTTWEWRGFFGLFGHQARQAMGDAHRYSIAGSQAYAQAFDTLLKKTAMPFTHLPLPIQQNLFLDLVPFVFNRQTMMGGGGHAAGNHVYYYRMPWNGERGSPGRWVYGISFDTDTYGRMNAIKRMRRELENNAGYIRSGHGTTAPLSIAGVLVRCPGGKRPCVPAYLAWQMAYGLSYGQSDIRNTKGARATSQDFATAASQLASWDAMAGCVGQGFDLASDPAAMAALVGKKG